MATWNQSVYGGGNLISPYGDYDASTDVSLFWDTGLDSVTTENVASASVVGGAFKIIATTSSDDCKYTKAIPVVVGRSYTIAGTTTSVADNTTLLGGITSGGTDYFYLLIDTSGIPDDFSEDTLLTGSLTFVATTDTLYLQFAMTDPSDYISIDDISLKEKILWSSMYNELKWNVWGNETTDNWSDWG
jgi:hypothetical protein